MYGVIGYNIGYTQKFENKETSNPDDAGSPGCYGTWSNKNSTSRRTLSWQIHFSGPIISLIYHLVAEGISFITTLELLDMMGYIGSHVTSGAALGLPFCGALQPRGEMVREVRWLYAWENVYLLMGFKQLTGLLHQAQPMKDIEKQSEVSHASDVPKLLVNCRSVALKHLADSRPSNATFPPCFDCFVTAN